MDANSMQVGGTHYQAKFQHWDLVIALKMPYLQAQITRYIARWRKKNGIEDLRKAQHYLAKFLEVEELRRTQYLTNIEKFIHENSLGEHERTVFINLARYEVGDIDNLLSVQAAITKLVNEYKLKAKLDTSESDVTFREDRDEWRQP